MKFLISAASLWTLATGLLSAAPGGKKIAVRFAAQTAPANLGELVMTAGELRSAPFALPLNNLSPAQTAPARAFRLELQEKPTVLATVTLPETGSDFIILLVPAVKSGFEAVVIPAGDGSFRPGDYYLHNVSRSPVVGKVGTSKFMLPSRQGKVVRPEGAREGRFYDVALGVREGATARVISTSRWPVGKQMRTYVFFFDNPQRQDIDFRAMIDLLGSATPTGFASWQAANSTTGTLADDHDHDGVPNGIEYFLGGNTNTTGFTPLPGVSNTGGTLSVTWTKATDYTGTYGTDFVVETSATLTGTWTTETLGDTVTITGNEVKYTFPSPLGNRKFARLKVTGP